MASFSPYGARPEPRNLRSTGICVRHPFSLAERVHHYVTPQVLHQRQTCGLHHVHDRHRAKPGGREQHPPGYEKRQSFRNLFTYSPNGKKDGIQIIPLSEVAAKDEFLNIKNVSRNNMMAAHRVPPQIMGIMTSNVGRFGDVEKGSMVFVRNELSPLQKKIEELNI